MNKIKQHIEDHAELYVVGTIVVVNTAYVIYALKRASGPVKSIPTN